MYFWTNTTVTVKGKAWRPAKCEQCARTYFYLAERQVEASVHSPFSVGTGAAAKQAEGKASQRLTKALRKATDAIPCPTCGWYQANMTKPFREAHYQMLGLTCIWSIILSVPILLFAGMCAEKQPKDTPWGKFGHDYNIALFVLGGLLVVGGIGMAVARDVLRARLHPNECQTEEDRLAIGKAKALTEEQFLALNPPLPNKQPPPTAKRRKPPPLPKAE